jgi:hypothetical protein
MRRIKSKYKSCSDIKNRIFYSIDKNLKLNDKLQLGRTLWISNTPQTLIFRIEPNNCPCDLSEIGKYIGLPSSNVTYENHEFFYSNCINKTDSKCSILHLKDFYWIWFIGVYSID